MYAHILLLLIYMHNNKCNYKIDSIADLATIGRHRLNYFFTLTSISTRHCVMQQVILWRVLGSFSHAIPTFKF